jgi:transcriptional regulator with XRE-family HTH domain
MDISLSISKNGPFLAMAHSSMSYDPLRVGARLRIAREVIKESGTLAEVAALIGEIDQRWNRWELGKTKLPVEVAFKLHDRFGIERDWLLYGDERFLNSHQRRMIAEAEARIQSGEAGRVKRA